jgi:hypothetical protein
MVSRHPPLPPQLVQSTLPNPLQSWHFCHPGEILPEPPQVKQIFLPLLQNEHFFHPCFAGIISCWRPIGSHFKISYLCFGKIRATANLHRGIYRMDGLRLLAPKDKRFDNKAQNVHLKLKLERFSLSKM